MAEPRPEPSMEDILASIKRIIADEPGAPPSAPARPASAAPSADRRTPPSAPRPSSPDPVPPWPRRPDPVPPESILELTERAADAFRPGSGEAPARPVEPVAPPVQRAVERLRQAEAEQLQPTSRPVPRDLMPRTPAPRASGGDVTLDALVREMLQPMLADWIERNLPDIVERIVETEIRRLMTDKS